MDLSQEIWQAILEGSQRRKKNGKIVDDHFLGYVAAFIYIGVMIVFLIAAIVAGGLIIDGNEQRLIQAHANASDILFLHGDSGWFGIPLVFAALIAAFWVTAALVSVTPFAKRAAAQSINLPESAVGVNAILSRAFNDWIISGIEATDPDDFLKGYWRRSMSLSANATILLVAFAAMMFWSDSNTYKIATKDGFSMRSFGSFSTVALGYSDIARIEVGCSQTKGKRRIRTRFRYELYFKDGERMELYSAWTPAGRLNPLEQIDATAAAMGAEIVHVNDLSRNLKTTQSSADAACAARVIDRYKRSNELRAFKLLRLDDPRA